MRKKVRNSSKNRISENFLTIFSVPKITMITIFLLLMTSCSTNLESRDSSSSNKLNSKVDHFIFSGDFMSKLKSNRENCQLKYLSTDYYPVLWKTSRASESKKYSWTKLSFLDDYEYLSDQGLDYKELIAESGKTEKCVLFLSSEVERMSNFEPSLTKKALDLYQSLLENRIRYLKLAIEITAFEYTASNRQTFFALADKKMNLTYEKENIFVSIREELDYDETAGGVKVHLERCPDSFNILGTDYVSYGSILLHNKSNSPQTVNFKVYYKTDYGSIIVGEQKVYEEIPARAKMRINLSANDSSDSVQGGAFYPATACEISF